jgi:hypothetical protein
MLMFLMGAGLPELAVILLLCILFGWLIYRISRRLLRRALMGASGKKINVLSLVSAAVLSPATVIASLALLVFLSAESYDMPESDEGSERRLYRMMEKDLSKKLAPGMSKAEVAAICGESDTTNSVVVYDLSLPGADKKYLLEVTYDKHGLKEFKRQR